MRALLLLFIFVACPATSCAGTSTLTAVDGYARMGDDRQCRQIEEIVGEPAVAGFFAELDTPEKTMSPGATSRPLSVVMLGDPAGVRSLWCVDRA